VLACLMLSGCAAGLREAAPAAMAPGVETVRPAPRPAVAMDPGAGRTAAALDATTPAERAAALAPAAGGRALGRTLASLGDPGQAGFWMVTPLVAAPRPGRVTHPASGGTVGLELRPSGGVPGSGSQLSLAAFRALGLPLTALVELEVAAQ
jgi:hypothetical protein